MKQGFVKVASATPRIRVADPVYNAQVICEQAKEAAEHRSYRAWSYRKKR